MNPRQSADDIAEAAAQWVWRLDREGHDSNLESQLEAWLDGGPGRRGAFLKAEAMWELLGEASARKKGSAFAVKRVWAVAAGIAVLATAVGALMWWPSRLEHYRTTVGEIRQVPLRDGSTAVINTGSAIAVSFDAHQRTVAIRDGEAWFRVAKDASRPFVVEVGRVRVRALGTAFSVRKRAHGADVLVTEGTVETWVAGAEGRSIPVSGGAKAFVADDAAVPTATAPDAEIDRVLAWRVGKIDLSGDVLRDAAAEFNRYNRRKITVTSPVLAQQRLYGVFRTDDPEGFARSVGRSLGASVSLRDENEIVLSDKKSIP